MIASSEYSYTYMLDLYETLMIFWGLSASKGKVALLCLYFPA